MILSITYPISPKRPTLGTAWVRTVFGLESADGEQVIADGVEVPYEPGRIVLFVGPSGSGKSSLLRAAAGQAPGAVWLDESPGGEDALIDTLGADPRAAAKLLAAVGLSEAPLLLRSAGELSDGQRYRYGVARCIQAGARTVVADEWCAKLDRVTAKVVSRNVRKLADRRGVGFLLATTHEDVVADLAPDTLVRCGGGAVEVRTGRPFCRAISFLDQLELTEGARTDWPYFARWHYRSHTEGFVSRTVLLWHGDEPIGICMVGPAALNSSARNAAFGLRGLRGPGKARLINDQFASVSRLVLDPRYRGAGIGALFLRRVAETTDKPWVELASEMANLVPFAEAAGFRRMGIGRDKLDSGDARCWYGPKKDRQRSWPGFLRRVRFSRPGYFVFDNRAFVVTP